ncbi:hypothetical protein LWM68_08965 [Niabella sp. W65]|nr:hypothetical protein [Niabella sp. W65]MCH7362888.1 hypothetical protein [Niabella sp. W65]
MLEHYFKTALIPAFNKYGVKTVGVFREWKESEPARFYLLIPYSSSESYFTVNDMVKKTLIILRAAPLIIMYRLVNPSTVVLRPPL